MDRSCLPALGKLFTGFLEGPMLMAVHTWPASILGSRSSQSIHHRPLGHLPSIETVIRIETAAVIRETVDIISDCGSMTLN